MRKGSRDQNNLVYRKAIYDQINNKTPTSTKAVKLGML
jgi:hypothetical protein